MKKWLSFLLSLIMTASFFTPYVSAEEQADIHIYFGGEEIGFEKPTVIKNGKIMCQMKPLFDALGMIYDYNALTKVLHGTFNDDMFTVTVGGDTLEINNITVELDEKFFLSGREIMVPLDMICYIYNIQIDRSDLTNVRLWLKEAEVYDLQAEIEKFNKVSGPYKTEIIKGGLEYFETASRQMPECFSEKYIDVEGQSFDKAIDWEATSLPATYYASQIVNWQKTPVKKDDVFVITFWAKGIFAKSDGGKIQLNVTLEQNKTWTKSISETVQLSTDWQQFRLLAISATDMDDWSLNFRQHFSLQEIQIADVKLDLYSGLPEGMEVPKIPATYKGMEEDALWRKEAIKRIEKYRKNNMTVNVTDKDGNPIQGATVNAKMTRSEFNWGSMVWNSTFENGHLYKTNSGFNGEKWFERFKDLGVNTLVGTVKAGEFQQNNWTAKRYADFVNWCMDNDIDVRAHCVYWETGTGIENRGDYLLPMVGSANWNIDSVSVDEVRARLEKQFNIISTFIGDYPIEIDVMNEIATRHDDGIKSVGWDEGVRMYQMVKAIRPNAKLVHLETISGNSSPEGTALPDHVAYTKYLKDLGAPIDICGIQGHVGSASHPQWWYVNIDMAAQVADEVAITEYDAAIPEYELRAPYLRDTLIACYSHPALSTFVVWVYNYDGKTPDLSVFWDKDENRHPAYYEWDKLVNHEWKTDETVTTDENGSAVIRGHRGRYDVTVTVGEKTQTLAFTLGKDETQNVINVVVDGDSITMTSPNVYVPKPKPAYYNWQDFGKMTEIEMPKVNYKWEPSTVIEDCRDAEGKLVPHVFDGRDDSFWSAEDNDDYLTVTLGKNVPLKSLVVHWHSGSIKRYNYRILVSQDGNGWTEVKSGKNSEMTETVDMSKFSGKYIRILGTDGRLAIDDVQVYTK